MDTKDTRVQNLLFLLSAAPLGMGCIITGGDDSATTDPATTTATATGTDTGSATGSATDTPMTSGATDPQTTTATGADTTAGADETTAGADTTSGVESPPACVDYANLNGDCYGAEYVEESLTDCTDYYAYLMGEFGEDCIDRFNEQLACLSGLTCKEFMVEEPPPCPDETTSFEEACSA